MLIVTHHTDDWTSVNVLMLPYHRVHLWTKMILHIRLLENCRISEHQGLHLLHLWQELNSIEIDVRLMAVNILTYFLSLISIHFLDARSTSVEAIPHSMQAIQTHIVYTGAMAIRWKKIENRKSLLWSNDFACVSNLVLLRLRNL